MKKYLLLSISLLVLNSMDILYLVSFKFDFPVAEMYIVILTLFFILIYNISSGYTLKNLSYYLLFIAYFLFQFFNGIINSNEPAYAFVTLFSFAFIIYLVQIFSKLKISDLYYFLKKIFYFTIILYISMDIFSILVMSKSQHVLLSNNLPFITLSGLVMVISEKSLKKIYPLLLSFFIYIFWIYISLTYFTTDHRMQMKALSLSFLLIIVFYFLRLLRVFVPYLRKRILLKRFSSFIILCGITISCTLIYLAISYLFNNGVEGRETSLGLRIAVASVMIDKVINGSLINLLFGYGLGSSMQEFFIEFGTSEFNFRSHSGILSLFYEHGIMSVILLIILIIRFSFNFTKRIENLDNQLYYDRYSMIIILILLISSWFFLNIVYLIAINVPNYGHQSQIIVALLLSIYLNRIIHQKKV